MNAVERSGLAESVVWGRDRGGREPQSAKPVHAIGVTVWAGHWTLDTCSELIKVSGMIIVSWLEAHFDFPMAEPEQVEATEVDVETESSQQTVALV